MRNVTNSAEGKINIVDSTDSTKTAGITSDGRLSVDIDKLIEIPVKVSAPIMITRYDIDPSETSISCDDTTDTLFKTWDFTGSFLKGITLVVEKKETVIKVFRDTTDLLVNVDCLAAESLFQLNSIEPLHPMFSLYRNAVGVYVCKMSFESTPFDKIEIKLRHAEAGSKDLQLRYGVLIYNRAYTG